MTKPRKFTMTYKCNFMYFQNEPSANPLRLLVNSRVGGLQQYPCRAIPNMGMYESTVHSVKLSPQCLHALHVCLHGLLYCITTHLEDVARSTNYRFISVVGGRYHIDCIGEYYLVIANRNSDICM